jgi:hypothetical protein
MLNFIVVVRNAGTRRAKEFKVKIDYPSRNGLEAGRVVMYRSCGPLDPGQVCTVYPGSSLYYPNTVGLLSIYVTIDPENKVPECSKHDGKNKVYYLRVTPQ